MSVDFTPPLLRHHIMPPLCKSTYIHFISLDIYIICLFIYIICIYNVYFDNKYHLSLFSLSMLTFFQCTLVLLNFNLHVFLMLECIIQFCMYLIGNPVSLCELFHDTKIPRYELENKSNFYSGYKKIFTVWAASI